MSRVVIDQNASSQLGGVIQPVELHDENGKLLGHFVPTSSLEPPCLVHIPTRVIVLLAYLLTSDSGVYGHQSDLDRALADQCWNGNAGEVTAMLKQGANPNVALKGQHVLNIAADRGDLKVMRLLLDHGADPNVKNNQGQTPLHRAISGDCELQTIKLLVQSGAKLDLPNNEGITPVRLAAIRGAKEVYEWLVAFNGGKEPRVSKSDARAPMQGAESTHDLLAALSSGKRELRLAAQRELVARGHQVMPDVLKAIESGIGIEYYELFAVMGPDAEAALPLLTAQLSNKEHVFTAALTLERMKPGAFATLPAETKQSAAVALYEGIVDPSSGVMAGFNAGYLVNMGKFSFADHFTTAATRGSQVPHSGCSQTYLGPLLG